MKERWAAVLLAACMMLLLPAAAFAEDRISITVQQVQGSTEGNVALNIDLAGCEGMDSLQMRVNYDQTALRLASVEAGALLDEGLHILNTDNPGLVAFAYAGKDGLTGGGTVMTLTFAPYSDQGSAVVVTDVLATRYDPVTGLQPKAFVTVQDGGVFVGEEGAIPDPVVTPWPEETPTPSPSPTPEPTPLPTETTGAEAMPENPAAMDGNGNRRILALVLGGILLLLVIAIVAVTRQRRRARRKRR